MPLGSRSRPGNPDGICYLCNIISWKSDPKSHRRKASSTLGAETIAASKGLSALDWTRTLFEECVQENFSLSEWEQIYATRPATLLTDCKLVYDALNQLWCSNAKTDMFEYRPCHHQRILVT
eukprot:973672-Amphidinium_carterae.1